MKINKLVLSLALCFVLLGTSFAFASSHVVFIGKGEQAGALEEYFSGTDIELTVVYSENLFDTDSPYFSEEALASYDAFIIGEIVIGDGLNGSVVMDPFVLEDIQARVQEGAGFAHVGGWTSYQGGNPGWSGQWNGTLVDEMLPVNISADWDTNDEGAGTPQIDQPDHPVVAGLNWDTVEYFGGYNMVEVADGGEVLVSDSETGFPLITVGSYGDGKTLAYTGGLGGGWDDEVNQWDDFSTLWIQIASFLAN